MMPVGPALPAPGMLSQASTTRFLTYRFHVPFDLRPRCSSGRGLFGQQPRKRRGVQKAGHEGPYGALGD